MAANAATCIHCSNVVPLIGGAFASHSDKTYRTCAGAHQRPESQAAALVVQPLSGKRLDPFIEAATLALGSEAKAGDVLALARVLSAR